MKPISLSLALSLCAVPALAIAQTAPPAGDAPVIRNPNDVPNVIRDANTPKDSLVRETPATGFLDRWFAFKNSLYEQTGFKFSVAYHQVVQVASSDNRWETGSGAGAEFDFTWEVFGRNGTGPKGLVGGKAETRFNFLNATAAQSVAPKAGSIWTGAAGYGEQDLSIPQLWYEHHLVRDRVLFRVGKIAPFAVFDYNKYKSPRTGFIGQPQNVNPTIPYPASALGFGGGARLTNGIFFAGGLFDANGSPIKDGFDSFFNQREFFAIGEVGWTPDFVEGLEPGKDYTPGNDDYHLTFWHSDGRKDIGRPEGWGFTGSVQKGFGSVVPFARYGYSSGGATSLKHLVSIGAGYEGLFGYDDDVLAVGLNWGEPSNSALDPQYGFEAFYRMQLTPQIAVTPDVQVIVDPATDPSSDVLGVFSIRGRIAL
ncbi:carbohydrate porin [Roseibium sp.]|uniref:carbohydrate porin n=1 Tax=Roseibium sp. TaxID=1936156 RepID=UPI003D0F6A0F